MDRLDFSQPRVARPTLRLAERERMKGAKPKPWTHQQDLAAGLGCHVTIQLQDGHVTSGKLIEADSFTLKVLEGEAEPTIVFKSAIASLRIRR